jgi:hypothetical protein
MGPILLCALLMILYFINVMHATIVASCKAKQMERKKRTYTVPPGMKGIFNAHDLDRYKTVFATIDADGDGSISPGELEVVLRSFDRDLLDDEIRTKAQAIMVGIDIDMNEEIGKIAQFICVVMHQCRAADYNL